MKNVIIMSPTVHKKDSQFSLIMVKMCWNAFVVTMFGTLNDVTPSLVPNVWYCKRTPSIITRQKSFQREHNKAFFLLVMLVIGVLLEVWQLNYTSSSFVMMIRVVVLEALGENMQLEASLCLLYGMWRNEHISSKMRWWHWRKLVFSSSRNQSVTL